MAQPPAKPEFRVAAPTFCLLTGATSGIGRETAWGLARAGCDLALVCRSEEKGQALADALSSETGADVRVLVGDLGVQGDVRRIAREYLAMDRPLHVLINNAGVQKGTRHLTEDGVEEIFAVNHLAPFLLTNLLRPLLLRSAPARVVNVGSQGYELAKTIDFDNLNGETSFTSMSAYAQSKLANMLFTLELSRRLVGAGVTVNALHPGAVKTSVGDELTGVGGFIWRLMLATVALTPEQGARTSLYLALEPEVAGVTGRYFVNCKPAKVKPPALDNALAQALWTRSEAMVHAEGGFPAP